MEKIPIDKRESPVSKVIGVSPEDEAGLLEFFREEFNKEYHESDEKEHSEELDNIIIGLNRKLEKFLSEYGVQSVLLPPANVHIFDWSKLSPGEMERTKKEIGAAVGFYNTSDHHIRMLIEPSEGNMTRFIKTLIHEMLHLSSFVSLEKTSAQYPGPGMELENEKSGRIKLIPRRVGFNIKTPDDILYFNHLDEAMIEMLAKKFLSEFPELTPGIREEDFSYLRDRESVNALIDDLYLKNKESFSSREDVFNLFVQAMFKGKLLSIARLMEKTYGKGAFRIMGETTSRKNSSIKKIKKYET